MNELYFDRFYSFAHGPSLEPIRALCEALGHPERRLRFIHAAGTNGKGSVCTMTAEAARAAGMKVGLYTSPHLVRFHERIRINGEPISDEALGRAIEQLKPIVDKLEAEGKRFAYFDAVTAAALLCFTEAGCDPIVWETGLGGRFDASNVIPPETVLVSVLVPIGLDHCGILGDTLEAIATEKAGIIKRNGTVIVSPGQPDEALTPFFKEAALQNATLIQPNLTGIEDASSDPLHPAFRLNGTEYRLQLAGEHQFSNAVTAIAVCRELRKRGLPISDENIHAGIYNARLPARLQVLEEYPLLIADGAHNPHGAAALAQFLHGLGKPAALVFGACSDKDVAGVVSLLAPEARCAATVSVPTPRSIAPLEAADMFSGKVRQARAFEDLSTALAWAREQVGSDGAVVVCGSLYLCGEMLERRADWQL